MSAPDPSGERFLSGIENFDVWLGLSFGKLQRKENFRVKKGLDDVYLVLRQRRNRPERIKEASQFSAKGRRRTIPPIPQVDLS